MSIFLLLKVFILCYICNYTWLFFLHLVYIVSLHQFFNLIGLVSHKPLNMLIFPISLIATFFSITPFYCFLWACFLDSFLASQVPGVPFLLFWYSPVKHIPPPSVIGWGFYLHIWVVCILEFPFSLVLFLLFMGSRAKCETLSPAGGARPGLGRACMAWAARNPARNPRLIKH